MHKINRGSVAVPVILLGITVLCYGITLRWFGFYGDDWSYIWYNHLLGSGGPGIFAALDRPLSASFYNLVVPLFGEAPLPYHLLMLALRWISGVLVWWVFRLVWPEHSAEAAWAGALSIVFPGFTSHPIAVEFILHFFVLDLFLFSVGGMLSAADMACSPRRRWLWTVSGMIFASSMFMLEYFVGLELLRPVLLWMVISRQNLKGRQRARRVFLAWLPYLAVLAAFAVWRVFIFKFPTYQPVLLNQLASAPLAAAADLAKRILLDFGVIFVDSWKLTARLGDRTSLILTAACLLALCLVFGWLKAAQEPEQEPDGKGSFWKEWALQPVLVGVFALLIAGWPFWITGIPVEAGFPWDRAVLPFIPGASLVVMGLAVLVVRRRFQAFTLALLVSLALGAQFRNAEAYRSESENLANFFWQLSWRAPQIQPGTVVVSDDIPLYRHSDNGLNAVLNWTYAPENHSRYIPYRFFDLFLRLDTEYSGLPSLKADVPFDNNYRSLAFSGNTSNLLAVYYQPGACLHVLTSAEKAHPKLTEKLRSVLPLSDLDEIQADAANPAQPPVQALPEPARSWCYYFEKADLARQKKDWEQVVKLEQEAEALGFQPKDMYELLPFMEASARQKNWEHAQALSTQIGNTPALQPLLCGTWSRMQKSKDLDADSASKISTIMSDAGCSS